MTTDSSPDGEPGPTDPDEPAGRARPDDLATLARLSSAELHVLGAFADASNTTLLVQLLDGDTAPVELGGDDAPTDVLPPSDLAVYKPVRGQRMLWDFDATTLPGREVATHLVDAQLGFRLVPPTVWRDQAPLGPGSLQAYVAHDPEEHWFTWIGDDDRRDREVMARLVVLDMVVNNTDRKAGHVLVAPAGRLWAIDHGVTFHVEDKLRTVCWELQGEPIPAELRQACVELASWLARRPDELGDHLTPEEIEAARDRAGAVALRAAFPVLVHRGQLPWPLV